MRAPVTAQAGHLLWTRAGTVWSVWRLQPLPYGFRPAEEKRRVRGVHTTLLRALQGEALLLGVTARVDPATVIERMIAGLDLEQHPAWALECEATLDLLEQVPLGERSYWLAVPIPSSGRRRLTGPGRAAVVEFADQLGLPVWAPRQGEIEQARQAAEAMVAATVPSPFRPRPASTAEMLWLTEHFQQRGLLEFPAPTGVDHDFEREILGLSGGGWGLRHPLLDEGGQTDTDRSGWRRLNPMRRRYLKVILGDSVGDDPPASYQCNLVLDDVPAGGMAFPGSEYLGRIDESGIDVDWAMRLTVRSSDESSRKIRRAVRDLNDQYAQRDGVLSTGAHELDRAAADLTSYEEALTADRNEVGVEATVIFTVAADTAEDAQAKARELARHLAQAEYRLSQPVGAQETLWWAGQPGVPTQLPIRQMAQVTTAADLAAAVPLASVDLGDRKGVALALNISSLRPSVVHVDLEAAATEQEASPAIAIAGSLGAGKSVLLKTLAGALVDRGGRLLTIDRTQSHEWARLAQALTSATVVNVLDPQVSLDPLRLFPGQAGARIAQSFLSALLNVPATSATGRLLSDVLDARYLGEHDLASLGQLTEHLEHGHTGEQDLASYLRTFARKDLGQVVFNAGLPPVDLTSPAIVFGTAGVQLPSREELLHEHLFRQMRLERIAGRAFYALMMALIRQIAFANPGEMVVIPLDEAHHVTTSPESETEVIELIRDGRKHKAAVALGSHDPLADFGSETLRGLIPTRLVGRQNDDNLARHSLDWLGLDPDDTSLVELLTRDTSPVDERTGQIPEERRGEALMRDSRGRIGRVKILAPSEPGRAQAVLTTPPKSVDQLAGLGESANGAAVPEVVA